MNLIDKFHNWRRKQRWNKQYKKGRWDNLRNPIEANRYKTIIDFITSHGKKQPSILDLGAGEGVLNEYLDAEMFSYFLGMDFSDVSIQKAKAKNFSKAEFVTADIHTYKPTRKFDVIIFNEAFYYIHESEKQNVLDRMLSHLEANGILIVSIYREGVGCWEYFEKLQRLGFTVVKTEEEKTYWKVGVYKL
ncbi:class I SAM-dependent methyltransferase [Kordia sp. YSTF-M3]|uniref:Class I SAM-dependent methyltransferase n=1 Tax=Kordia aestuariivivens TaxID=2759037 RepID=A0ABR7Q599_9FLAO|nr:class I SAM-dependent methyltransferase [Kordia aestuariivivens]MBC8753697.1 class I SAM-dependent methyltransferase [Kordia aestuariivivens]